MKDVINNDNCYQEGTIICAKVDPALKLIITKYRQRIYYCSVVDHPEQNNLAYFEKELIAPEPLNQVQFVRVEDLKKKDGFGIKGRSNVLINIKIDLK